MNNNFNNSADTVYSRFTSHFSLKTSAFTLAEGATHVALCADVGSHYQY